MLFLATDGNIEPKGGQHELGHFWIVNELSARIVPTLTFRDFDASDAELETQFPNIGSTL